ncbi:single-pass membrane and coiled-coil domain-containing protein 4 isoform X1 [Pongo pygmaeus]|uniref:single-pass membrane and coiled-coil domain-containing protein 4 isoform X1 n=1 Tax=Pongo pygmaeus TaxID=9600 RepID=UPI0023E2A8BF|nr:single-pass membrane and coiled-coil domain-containing protein 4 isoform X1 [Pongo pygmaeus]
MREPNPQGPWLSSGWCERHATSGGIVVPGSKSSWFHILCFSRMLGITQVTCTGNQFAEITQSTILEVEEKEVLALTRGVWPFLESLWTHPPSIL